MTTQEAIRELHNIRPRGGIIPQKRAEALDAAIKALKMQAVYGQVCWERDVAIMQLEEVGLSLGEKTNKVKEALEKQASIERILERLEEELRLADEEKERCARENPLQFDSAKGYATGIYNAIQFIKEEVGQIEEAHN